MTFDNYINTTCNELKKILLQTVELFPDIWLKKPDYNKERYIRIALLHIVEFGEKDPEKIIKRRSGEDWKVDNSNNYIALTQKEEDFNEKMKK